MSKKEDADRSAWLEEVKKHFASDPDALAALDKVMTHPASTDVFYRGTLRQDEFHRRLNEVNAEKQQIAAMQEQYNAEIQKVNAYYATEGPKNEALLKHKQVLEAEKAALEAALLARGEEPRALLGRPQERQVSEQESALVGRIAELERALGTMSSTLPVFLTDAQEVSFEIAKNGWNVSPKAVMDFALTRGVRASQALAELTVQERQQRQEAEIQKRIDAAREEAKRELMAAHPTSDFARSTPRYARVEDMQKAMTALGDRESRRDAAIEEARKAVAEGARDFGR